MLGLARTLVALLLTAVAQAGGPPPSCTDPVQPCPIGWLSDTTQANDSHGTPAGNCPCPGGGGCTFAFWSSYMPALNAPQLELPKFSPPGGLYRLDAVELIVRGNACGEMGVENRSFEFPCSPTMTLRVVESFSAAPGQGLDFLAALIPSPVFDLQQSVGTSLQPFDGTVDFAGPSGHTEQFAELSGELCVRITDPAQLAVFVDDGVGPSVLYFDHGASDSSSLVGCAPVTFVSEIYAGIELEVRYRACVAPDTTFCFGTNATCPCGNGGAADTGCDNAQATGGVRLTGSGDTNLNDVTLQGTGFPPAAFPTVIVIRSPLAQAPPVTFGDGLRCISTANLVRLAATLAAGGASTHPISHGAGSGLFNYQLWYRNTPSAFCDASAAFNTSNALQVVWP